MNQNVADEITLVRRVLEGDQMSWEELKARFAEIMSQCIRSYADNEDHIYKVIDGSWSEIRRKLPDFEATQSSFQQFVENRTKLIGLRYYAFTGRKNSSLVEALIRELQNDPTPFLSDLELEEVSLVILAQDGDVEAFNQLWSRCHKSLHRYIKVRVKDNDIADELLNKTFLALSISGIQKFDPFLSRFRTFAGYCAEAEVRRYYSSEKRRRDKEVQIDPPQEWEDERPTVKEADLLSKEPLADEALIKLEQIRMLLRVTFNLTSPPHQLIVFGFNKLLGWDPKEIVEKLSRQTLRDLEIQLKLEYIKSAIFEEEYVRGCFEKLRNRMEEPLGSVVKHPKARQTYLNLLDRLTGDILLKSFYSNEEGHKEDESPEDKVSKWSDNVRKSVIKRMIE